MKSRLVLLCHDDFLKWAEEFAESETRETPGLLLVALTEYAKAKGFKKPPPR